MAECALEMRKVDRKWSRGWLVPRELTLSFEQHCVD